MQAVFYRDSSGMEPVDAFISELDPEVQEEVDYTVALLNRLSGDDHPLPFPFSSQVQGQLRELRCHYGRRLYRIPYRRSRNLFVLLHALEKRTAAIPAADVATAEARWEDFKVRMDAPRRTHRGP